MRIAALTYTFGTQKIEAGIHHLVAHGFKPDLILAAPPVTLDFYRSKIRIAPQGIPVTDPHDLASGYNIGYSVAPHNSERAKEVFLHHQIDVAVILGARIIKQPLINATSIGILNMHPGRLPDNRGLDNLKWGILLGMPQGVTGHLIDRRVDRGRQILWHEAPVCRDDTMMDLHLRLQAMERVAMIESLRQLKRGDREFPAIGKGVYRRAVPEHLEAGLLTAFENYKNERGI